jgi:hypothetical protein
VQWRVEAPFSVSPPAASLAPGESMHFTVSFTPPEACSYTANAACQLESGAAAICKVGCDAAGLAALFHAPLGGCSDACAKRVLSAPQPWLAAPLTPQVSGIGKFPYLSVEQAGVDFGPVVVGQRVERTVRFGNHSVVPANFSIAHDDEGANDGVFSVTPARWAGSLCCAAPGARPTGDSPAEHAGVQ